MKIKAFSFEQNGYSLATVKQEVVTKLNESGVYFEGFSNREAALVMGKSVHAVETLVYRARLALKDSLKKGGFVYENV